MTAAEASPTVAQSMYEGIKYDPGLGGELRARLSEDPMNDAMRDIEILFFPWGTPQPP